MQRHRTVAARRGGVCPRVVARFGVGLPLPDETVAGRLRDLLRLRIMDRQMQGHHRIAALRIGERLCIVAGPGVGHPVPDITVARCRRNFRRLRMVNRQVHRHHAVAAVDVGEHLRDVAALLVFVASPFEDIAGGHRLLHRVGFNRAQPILRRAVAAHGGDAREIQRVGVTEKVSAPLHGKVAGADHRVEDRQRWRNHRDMCQDHAVAARGARQLLHVHPALRIDTTLPLEHTAHRGVERGVGHLGHLQRHHHHAVAAVTVLENLRLGAGSEEHQTVPAQRKLVLAADAVNMHRVRIVHRQLYPASVRAAVGVVDDALVNPRFRIDRVEPRIAVADRNLGDHRGGVRHVHVDRGGAIAPVDVGDGDALRARLCECETPHGHRQALRADQRVELHRVRVVDRHVRRHNAVAAVTVLQRLRIHSALRVYFPVPDERPAHDGVESGDARRVYCQGQSDNGVATETVGESFRINT